MCWMGAVFAAPALRQRRAVCGSHREPDRKSSYLDLYTFRKWKRKLVLKHYSLMGGARSIRSAEEQRNLRGFSLLELTIAMAVLAVGLLRSEERRVGKEC